MRYLVPLLVLAVAGGPAAAQTTVEPSALDALSPPAAHPAPPRKPPPRPVHRPAPAAAHPAAPVKPPPVVVATPTPPIPEMPLAPPPLPVIPPPIAVPTRPVAPPLPATITDQAPGTATPIPGGLRLTFGPDSTDLNPATAAALRSLAHDAKPNTSFDVSAYAAGPPDDPSTPRRLSLSRAMSVRSLLIGEGIASTRIFPKALGATATAGGPPDRADILVFSPPPPASPPPSASPPPAPVKSPS